MDSSKISDLAEGARVSLMDDVRHNLQRVLRPQSDERLAEPNAVRELECFVANCGEEKAIEEIAYTWFNRLCALRFMDMRGYTPVGCVTSRPGGNLPAVLADAREGVFAGALHVGEAQKRRVEALLRGEVLSTNPLGEAYTLLLLAVCDSYRDSMGYLFGGGVPKRTAMRLLAPSDLLSENSVLTRICAGMDGDACESVEVLGWLYQFYIAERKNEYFASGRKATPEDIAPATQLFTPKWIVRYLVDNSIGRLWMLNNPGSELVDHMDYYIKPDGAAEGAVRVYGPEDITVCDPACGSGHILVYAFDLLFEMYLEEGYRACEIPQLILENNLYGFEISDRAAEIASFALEMKAREKDPDFFGKRVDANITVLEPVAFTSDELAEAGFLAARADLLEVFEHLGEVGSLYMPEPGDDVFVEDAIQNVRCRSGLFAAQTLEKLEKIRNVIGMLSKRFTCVVANPPYMGSGNMNAWLSAWVKKHYPSEKKDLCTCFINRGFLLSEKNGYIGIITSDTCMYITSFEKMRKSIIGLKTIVSLLDTRGSNAHPDVFDANAAWLFWNNEQPDGFEGSYFKLNQCISDKGDALKEAIRDSDCSWFYRANAEDFKKIPGNPIAYWASSGLISVFKESRPLADVSKPRQGLITGNNELFLRFWWEVDLETIGFGISSRKEAANSTYTWYPCNKGGNFRKWYGNNDYVVNWANDGREIKSYYKDGRLASRPQNMDFYFKEGLTWSTLSSGRFAMRFSPTGFISEHKGTMCFGLSTRDNINCLGVLNSSSVLGILDILCPTLDFGEGAVGRVPIPNWKTEANEPITDCNIKLSKADWDSFETSWDFRRSPLLPPAGQHTGTVQAGYERWKAEANERFDVLKANEEELNCIFAEIYHMQDEVPIQVEDKYVSVARVFDVAADIPESFKDNSYVRTKADEVKGLISYGVGCILGRYSIDRDGLILADQGSTLNDYLARVPNTSFTPDEDGILPVLAEEWFEDDVVAGFKRWLSAAFGADAFDANVAFIEGALGCDLRTYFVKDFYKDHCSTYSVQSGGKRPIYWLFQSPKKSFQALVYMHRMDKDTVTRVLTDYVQPFRRKLDAQVQVLRASGSNRDASKASRYRAVIKELVDWERDVLYPLSQKHIQIDLDDGVKANYPLFKGAVAKVQGLL